MNENLNPLFSILIANYNNGKYLSKALESAINQTYKNIEIIIVDDCSTDQSIGIISNYKKHQPNIILIQNDKNYGCGYTKNKCVSNSQGVICGFLDSDDYLELNAVKIMVQEHLKSEEISLVYSNFLITNNKESVTYKHIYSEIEESQFLIYGLGVNHFTTFKRDKYLLTEGINPKIKRAVDRDLVLKLEEVGKVKRIKDYLYIYRINENSISNNENSYKAEYWAWIVRFDACNRRGLKPEQVYSNIMKYRDDLAIKSFVPPPDIFERLILKICKLPVLLKHKIEKLPFSNFTN